MPQYRQRPGRQAVAFRGGPLDGAVIEMPDELAARAGELRLRVMSNDAVYYRDRPVPVHGAKLITPPKHRQASRRRSSEPQSE
jgi:hypothetical protein